MDSINNTKKCNHCDRVLPVGGDNGLVRHHIIPRALGGTDDESNLEWLCHSCHGKVTWQLKSRPNGVKRKDRLIRLTNDVADMLERYRRPNESANEVVFRLLCTFEEARDGIDQLRELWSHTISWQT